MKGNFEGSRVDRVISKWSHSESMNHKLSSPGEQYLKDPWELLGEQIIEKFISQVNNIPEKESFLIFSSFEIPVFLLKTRSLSTKCQLSIYHSHKEFGKLEMRTNLIINDPVCILFPVIFPLTLILFL